MRKHSLDSHLHGSWLYQYYEKNHLIAKSIASYVVEEIIKANPVEWDKTDIESTVGYWGEVLEEINKIRGYDNNIHDGNDSTNS